MSRSKEMIPISAAVNSENPSMIKAAKWSFSPFHPLSLTTRQSTFAQYTNCLAPLLEVYFLGRLSSSKACIICMVHTQKKIKTQGEEGETGRTWVGIMAVVRAHLVRHKMESIS